MSHEELQAQDLERLASKPNTTVYKREFDRYHEPWQVERLRTVLSCLVKRVLTFDEAYVTDFAVRKACLDDPETLAFQRDHPKLYWLATDRALMRDEQKRNVLLALLQVRERDERGEFKEPCEADAAATAVVMRGLPSHPLDGTGEVAQ